MSWQGEVAPRLCPAVPGALDEHAVAPEMLDVSLHERRLAERMRDPEYRQAYERAAREIAQTDAVVRALDLLRAELGLSKAELARRVNRNASSVRRLFTADQARPEIACLATRAFRPCRASGAGAKTGCVVISLEACHAR